MIKKTIILCMLWTLAAINFTCTIQANGNTAESDASIVSYLIPSVMIVGKTYPVSVTVKNEGRTSWTSKDSFRLGAIDDTDPFSEGRQYLPDGKIIKPGEEFTFLFSLQAPQTPGSYVTDWRMVQDSVSWFGEALIKKVEVTTQQERGAVILSESIPTKMGPGTSYSVSVTVRNEGTTTWTDNYRLGAVGDSDDFAKKSRLFHSVIFLVDVV
ncbi:NBR1-Ig-like domain-containing protein [Paenibacillus chitinolyticus]|uniref:NBR1-Ig-like domain-containing protein n=1 Tax=Paenibacillus chitinolyticus TaxID=79263 RepID=UPI0035576BEC